MAKESTTYKAHEKAFEELNAKLKYLPYWDQNHSFVIFLDSDKSFLRTIYYEKIGYSRKINPISIGSKLDTKESLVDAENTRKDHRMLLECFCQFWIKANKEKIIDDYTLYCSHNQASLIEKIRQNDEIKIFADVLANSKRQE